MGKHVILDRDGTLIRHIDYLCDPAQVEILPTVVEGIEKLRNAGYTLYLHTNQSGVGRGYFTLDDVDACNQAMIEKIGLGNIFAGICIAPERPDEPSRYRKPLPSWGLEVMAKANIDKNALWYIGDSLSDLLAAKNIGCNGIGVNTGLNDLRAPLTEANLHNEFLVYDRFIDAASEVLAHG
jgi:D-glycero-D-manno-heptose 1,7-bisphosphate phosphatase